MTDSVPDAFSRVCPACARRVPRKVAACRCGQAFDALTREPAAEAPPIPWSPPPATPAARGPSSSLLSTIVIAGATGIAVFAWMATRQDATVPVGAADRPPPAPIARTAPLPVASVVPAFSEPMSTATAPPPAASATLLINPSNPPVAAVVAGNSIALEDIISRAMPAVVRVETTRGSGSGFFVAADTILTNVHVVTTDAFVTIRRSNGTTMTARVDLTAPEFDIAVLRIAPADPAQAVLALGAGLQARPGQEVIALGTPLGLQNTVTRGIVSAVREVGGVTLVQTDAAINPGNSGGPLIDRGGLVIGIATMSVQSSAAQGLSFGIAIEHARAVMAGQKAQTTASTPVAGLNQAMKGRPATSDAETMRNAAARSYDQQLEVIARKANTLDARWRSFKSSCYEGRIAGTFDHEWFALWEPKAMQGAVSSGCGPAFNDLRQAADSVRAQVMALNEAARQADIYPGTQREVLRRHQLDYAGWASK
jgi:S1-C subfamily serine protease